MEPRDDELTSDELRQVENDLRVVYARRDPSAAFTSRVMEHVRREGSAPVEPFRGTFAAEPARRRPVVWRWAIAGTMAASLAVGVYLQQGEVQNANNVADEQAEEVVRVNLDGKSLAGGSKLLKIRNGVTEPVKSLLGRLKGIYVRRFCFGRKEAYSAEDIGAIHKQVEAPGWVPVIEVKDRNKAEAVSIYSYVEDEEVKGVTVVSEEEQEFTVINIVGDVDLRTLSELGESMGLPAMNVATTALPAEPSLPVPEVAEPEGK